MQTVQLFAVEDDGIRPLPVADHITSFDQLYDGSELGVYSALRTFDHNKFLYLAQHIQRTLDSMRRLGWADGLDEARLRQGLHEACTQYPLEEARVRFDYLAAPPRHLQTASRLLIGLMPFTPPTPAMYQNGIRLGFAPELARQNPLVKTADFAQARRIYPIGGEIYEHLLVNEQNQILEGTSSNFYGVLNGVLHTAGEGVLAGITRQIVLDLAKDLQIPISLEPIHVDEIPQLREAAISSASRALLPVVQIGDQMVGNGRPGSIIPRLLAAYNDFVAQAVETAV